MNTSIRNLSRDDLTRPIVQISLDLTSVAEALTTAAVAVEAGVDWLEIGTPLILAEGLHAVRRLHQAFPDHPLIVDLKTMDGGYLEAEMMAQAGASAVVVMARAHDATISRVCEAGERYGLLVMGDDLAEPDRVAAARRLESLGVSAVIHHVGFDHRGLNPGVASPLEELGAIVAATTVPVQAVGGLSIEQAIACPGLGAPLVVFGAPLAISATAFATVDDLAVILGEATTRVHQSPIRYPGGTP
ncbi:MAG: orotidine 5'-phosphate decarboxylase / HUMPS family protein [Propionibacteriaceae bacterium]